MSRAVGKDAVNIDPISGIIRIDQIIVGRRIVNPNGETYLQFKDRDKLRSNCRGDCLVEVRLIDLVAALSEAV